MMFAISRRSFLKTTSCAIGVAVVAPAIEAAPVLSQAAKPQVRRWFAVGHSDEMAYPFRASSARQAAEYYAHEHGYTKGDECPECGEYSCKDHLTPDQWGEPQDCIFDNISAPKSWEGLESEPTNVQWLRAGFYVRCENPDCHYKAAYWETQECYEHDGKALCECCLEIAKANQ